MLPPTEPVHRNLKHRNQHPATGAQRRPVKTRAAISHAARGSDETTGSEPL